MTPHETSATELTNGPSESRRQGARRSRLPALDGIRGIGIVAVVIFHLNPSWLPGGYLGVDIFFVVSGFLITGLLLDLFEKGTRSSLAEFWARRARRLVPGLVVLLLVVAVAAALFAPDAVPELRADIPAALGFVANWRLLLHHDNYFQAIGRPPLLQHLWSLGVEEQFYLIWPFVVLLVVRTARRRPLAALCWTASLGAAGSALLMALLYVPGQASSVYYDTFTHSSGLLIGAALAGATRGRRVDLGALARRRRAQLGALAFGGLVLLLIFCGASGSFAYRGGILLASALTGLVLVVSLRAGPLQRLLCARPLRYLGTRSYSLYLWHWPIICLTRPSDVGMSGAPLLVFRLVLIGGAAEASYHFVEQPFRTGKAQAALRAWQRPARIAALSGVGACGLSAVSLLAVVNPPPLSAALLAGSTPAARVALTPTTTATASAPTTTSLPTRPRTASSSPASTPTSSPTPSTGGTGTRAGTPTTSTPTTSTPTTMGATTLASGQTVSQLSHPGTTPTTQAGSPTSSTSATIAPGALAIGKRSVPSDGLGHQVLALGDSVLLAASTALEQRLHGDVTVDAVIGRQVWDGLSRLSQYKAAGDFRGLKAIVIDLGTNGPMYPWDVTRFRQIAAGVPLLVFVNVRVPQPWQATSNQSLAAVADQPGIRVVNWYAASAAPGVLWPDHIHPDPKGQALFANLVAQALAHAGVAGAS